ncbi:MAG: tetratricopeptide repeat protein [bacterium]|nr:tetratricopeptide repeat protein [bacterium]MDD3624226.1 tetratricopeptide repeat protein [Proteiniphilum sp.]MDD3967952.1 tetratricopeptide repeat protein [Proteiniphilum sp.]MDD4458603.1 tetratricopeptide repeat protein [Proteiniphilum sp.]
MTKERLYDYILEPAHLDGTTLQELEQMVERYPFFHTSRLLLTKNLELTGKIHFGDELAKTALLCCDRRKLLYLIRKEQYHKFLTTPSEREQHTTDRTEALLDSFLSTLSDSETEETTLPDIGLHVAGTDYFAYLESLGAEEQEEKEQPPLQHQEIIDAFIEKAANDDLFTPVESFSREKTVKDEKNEDGGAFLTETLARIYIKQRKYEQAVTIIKRLSLNFPKKSVYFADQIRFLEYLIANEKNKNK